MNGILYGVGVGPGDPELMTLKAVRIINENDVIALPGKNAAETVAYKIADAATHNLSQKTLLSLDMPMTHDKNLMHSSHLEAAKQIEAYLDKGKNVVFLTLGDPAIYSTFSYVSNIVMGDGYSTELISGITSFCAAAAKLNSPLTEWSEPLHIIPAVHKLSSKLDWDGNYVLMKSGSHMKEVKELLSQTHTDVKMVENCGMPNEKVYESLSKIPDDCGYYSLVIAKKKK